MTDTIKLVVGYVRYDDLQALEQLLHGADVTILSAVQDAQRALDDAVNLGADAVLISPQTDNYTHTIIQDLIGQPDRPIFTVGWISVEYEHLAGPVILDHGAVGFITWPVGEEQVERLKHMLSDLPHKPDMATAVVDALSGPEPPEATLAPSHAALQLAWQMRDRIQVVREVDEATGQERCRTVIRLEMDIEDWYRAWALSRQVEHLAQVADDARAARDGRLAEADAERAEIEAEMAEILARMIAR